LFGCGYIEEALSVLCGCENSKVKKLVKRLIVNTPERRLLKTGR
jgi:hypothetical protein